MKIRTIACALAMTIAGHAQTCPDVVVKSVESKITVSQVIDCSTKAVLLNGSGASIRGCPSVVVVEPPYDTPQSQPGSYSYVRMVERLPVLVYAYSCEADWFVFIPIGSSCRLVDRRVVGHRLSYEQFPCPVSTATSSATGGGA